MTPFLLYDGDVKDYSGGEIEMLDKEKKYEEPKIEEADSHFEAENLNKYDCLNLKEKNLVISEYETEYVDPLDEEVKDIKNYPDVDLEEIKKRNPDELLKEKE